MGFVNMKFERDKQFDAQFDEDEELRWYPYVGKRFGENGTRIMVYAHNIPIDTKRYDKMRDIDYKPKDTWASCLDEYIYPDKSPGFRRSYTNTIRYFIKGAVGLKANYDENSELSIIQRVDLFVEKIAYLNFIQDLVKSDAARAVAKPDQIELSKRVNRKILRILGITHCICWGKPTYEYVCSMEGYKRHSEIKLGKSGFSSCIVDVGGGKTMKCLRIFHPSMPGFGSRSEITHSIISSFLCAGLH